MASAHRADREHRREDVTLLHPRAVGAARADAGATLVLARTLSFYRTVNAQPWPEPVLGRVNVKFSEFSHMF